MSDDQPHFRFFPTAYEVERTFERSEVDCEACGRPAGWLYVGTIYTTVQPQPKVCARCIADGGASSVLGSDYGFSDATFGDEWSELPSEVGQRTPGFATFNSFTWPGVGKVPMAFLGYGDKAAFWDDERVRLAMNDYWREKMDEELDGPTPYLLIFRALDGEKYGFAIDFD